jgi:hypothetical protein
MSFREKSAWISLGTLLVVFGVYFWNVARIITRKEAVRDFPLFLSLLGALIVAEVVFHVMIAIRSPSDARTPRDEREVLIDLKATRTAFFVLLAGAFLSIATLHLGTGAWVMAHAVLLSVVVAEIVKFGRQIVLYRRDT